MDEQGATSEATYTYQDDQAIFLRSLEPGESFIDGNGNMFTANFDGRIISGSADLAYDYYTRTEFKEQTNDFTYEFDSPNEFELLTPIATSTAVEIVNEITGSNSVKVKKTKSKNKNKGKKYKIKYAKTKSTILKGNGKFRKGGNRRSRNKKINFSGKRRY